MTNAKFTVGQTVYLKYTNRSLKACQITAVGRKYVTIGRYNDRFEINQGIRPESGFVLEKDYRGISPGVVYLEEAHYNYIAIVAERKACKDLQYLFNTPQYGRFTRPALLELRAAIDVLLNLFPDPSSVK